MELPSFERHGWGTSTCVDALHSWLVPPAACICVSNNVCATCVVACAACRAGELSAEELEQLMTIVANPQQYKIPNWFLNRCEHSPQQPTLSL